MKKTSALDLSVFCEKIVAMEILLQSICANLSPVQSEAILKSLQHCREQLASIAEESDGAAWTRALNQLSQYEAILGGFPSKPVVH